MAVALPAKTINAELFMFQSILLILTWANKFNEVWRAGGNGWRGWKLSMTLAVTSLLSTLAYTQQNHMSG